MNGPILRDRPQALCLDHLGHIARVILDVVRSRLAVSSRRLTAFYPRLNLGRH